LTGERFLIEGGHRLQGTVRLSGSKNAALHTLAATLLTGEDCYLENVPAIGDVRFMLDIMQALGTKVERTPEGGLRLKRHQQLRCAQQPGH